MCCVLAARWRGRENYRTFLIKSILYRNVHYGIVVFGTFKTEESFLRLVEYLGYDPLFQTDGYDRSNGELTPEEKNAISHRGKALRQIREELEKYYADK